MLDLSKLQEAARFEGGVSRRLFLAYAASLSAIPWLGRRATAATRRVSFTADPFTVGVASGDPSEHGIVLWTRLAARPLEPAGGLPPEDIEVSWEIARDESMRDVVNRGTSVASPQLGHSVHVEVDNLSPDRWYWYRFRAGDAESPIGRTRTMPTAASTPRELRFAFASCQHYESGLFTAYEHMAKDDVDLVFHLGDYIYEYAGEDGRVRKHVGKETASLEDYRIRHAQYKTDPLLQAMHARCPWMVTWDDHEFDNNCANDICEVPGVDPVKFLARRAHAYQAYYEMMPLRHTSLPSGPRMQLYRKLKFGRLAEFMVLDTRQYRTDQPCEDGIHAIDEAALSPKGSMLGAEQLDWVKSTMADSPANWNVLAQQVLMGLLDLRSGDEHGYYIDGWPGYMHERQRLMEFLYKRQIRNPVVLTGDYHANIVNDLRIDDRVVDTPVVATEIVGTSISSDGNGVEKLDHWDAVMAENPGVRFYNAERGYVRCTVTPEAWRSDFRVVSDVTRPGGTVQTRASYVIESGRAGARLA